VCAPPFSHTDESLPYDCNGNYCGAHGQPRATYTDTQPLSRMCICSSKFKTVCSSYTEMASCGFCETTLCLHGGYPFANQTDVCACVFPYKNGPLGLCESTLCSVHATGFNATACICSVGYIGPTCSEFNAVLVIPPIHTPSSSSSSSSTGTRVIAYSSTGVSQTKQPPPVNGCGCKLTQSIDVITLIILTLIYTLSTRL
jgi:hypothetical protein